MASDPRASEVESYLELVEFEQRAPRSLGRKEEAIRREFGLSPMRYYQRLNRAIDVPEVMQAHPLTTARLRRMRDSRQQEREKRLT